MLPKLLLNVDFCYRNNCPQLLCADCIPSLGSRMPDNIPTHAQLVVLEKKQNTNRNTGPSEKAPWPVASHSSLGKGGDRGEVGEEGPVHREPWGQGEFVTGYGGARSRRGGPQQHGGGS